jgi:hypothetical protein
MFHSFFTDPLPSILLAISTAQEPIYDLSLKFSTWRSRYRWQQVELPVERNQINSSNWAHGYIRSDPDCLDLLLALPCHMKYDAISLSELPNFLSGLSTETFPLVFLHNVSFPDLIILHSLIWLHLSHGVKEKKQEQRRRFIVCLKPESDKKKSCGHRISTKANNIKQHDFPSLPC